MYDKTVRRRRALLALLVVLSLVLLTAYFGEASGGRLHAIQRDFLTIVSPLQDGANKALKPVRDAFDWIGETLHAKGQRDRAIREENKLRREKIADQAEKRELKQLIALYHLNRLSLDNYHPVAATVIDKSPSIWYSTVTIDKGSPSGIRVNDPVVNSEGLVGKVVQVEPNGAQVDLITDSTMGVSARIGTSSATGLAQPKVGDPNDLLLQYLPTETHPNKGELVVTSGTVSARGDSLFPPGILIGEVISINEESGFESVNVRPSANLHNLDIVEVLTAAGGGRAASLSALSAKLPPGQRSATEVNGEQLASTTGSGP